MKTKLAFFAALAFAGCHHSDGQTTAPQPDFQTAPAPRAMASRIPTSPGTGRLEPAGWVFFASDSDALSDAANQDLDAVVDWLKDHPTGEIVVEGHADAAGEAEHNLELSFRRGAAVEEYLVSKGVPRDRLTIKPQGDKDSSPDVLPGDRRVVILATHQ